MFVQRGRGRFLPFAISPRKAAKAHKRACDAPSRAVRAVNADERRVAIGRQNGGHIAGSTRKELLAAAARPKDDGDALRIVRPLAVEIKLQPIAVFVEGYELGKIGLRALAPHPDENGLLCHNIPPVVFALMIAQKAENRRSHDKNRGNFRGFRTFRM